MFIFPGARFDLKRSSGGTGSSSSPPAYRFCLGPRLFSFAFFAVENFHFRLPNGSDLRFDARRLIDRRIAFGARALMVRFYFITFDDGMPNELLFRT